jgi:TonB-dependent starch-binding outer membrane protein SusC
MKKCVLKHVIYMTKLFAIAFLIQSLSMSVLIAGDGNAQVKSIEEVQVSISMKNVKVERAFKELEKNTGYNFVFATREIRNLPSISIESKGQSVYDVLKDIAFQTDLSFKQVNENIHVNYSKKQNNQENITILREDVTVSGTVKDSKGDPLPGVSVIIEGTARGTVTDLDGNYTIEVPEGGVLLFAFIGFEKQSIVVGNSNTINLVLQEETSSLDEVVVIGYGTVKKRDITGSVSSLGSKDFNPGMVVSVDQLIAGRAAGVQITQSSAEPGGGVTIRIRGANSITANNEPLYVIDGLPLDNAIGTPQSGIINNPTPRNPLNALSPSDIESVEVLKDASATAIYGSRGANGVILITTKKGKSGKMRVNYNGYYGTQQVANRVKMLNAQQYMALLNDLRAENNLPPEFSNEDITQIGSGTDWQSEIFRDAPVQNHQISFSGGDENLKYFASMNYFDQEGVVVNSGMKRYTGRMNLEYQGSDKLSFGMNLNASYIKDNFAPFGVGINENAGVINSAIYQDPTMPIFDNQGNYFQSPIVNLENPVAFAKEVLDVAETNRTFGNFYTQYKITNDFSVKVNFGSDRQNSRRDNYLPQSTRRGSFSGGTADVRSIELSNYLIEITGNYSKNFENHQINALLGYSYQEFTGRSMRSAGQNFPSDAFQTDNLNAGNQGTFNIGSNRFKNQLLSYLGRINYTLNDKYLLTVSARADGSSRFGENNKFGFFPSMALGWRIIDETFMKSQNIFSELKFRGSYGLTGNQEIGNYNSLILLGPRGQAQFDGSPQVGISTIQAENPDLKWEVTRQFNVGLDAGFLDGRIDVTLDYFIKNTDDLLLLLPIPRTTGFSSSLQNVGGMRNNGFEFSVSSRNLVGKFTWNTSLNLSFIRNQVLNIGELPFIIQGGAGFAQNISIIQPGYPLNSYFGFIVDGVFQLDDDIAGSPQPRSKPGEFRYRDINGDGQINADDRTILGSPFPDLTYGLNNAFGYKKFEFSFFLQGVHGVEIFNFNRVESENPISFRRNRLEELYTNRWTPSNPTNENSNGQPVSVAYGGPVNSRAVEDASYLRLKNVQLNYRIPLKNSKTFSNANIYVSGQNLLTFTNYSGMDPEVSSFGISNVRADYNAYPFTRMYTIGLNLEL